MELEAETEQLGRRRADSDSLVDYCCASLESCATSCGSSSPRQSWADLSEDACSSEALSWADMSDDNSEDQQIAVAPVPPGTWSSQSTPQAPSKASRKKRKAKDLKQETPQQSTTVVIRSLAKHFTREDVAGLLDARGFAGLFNFLYAPVDFKSHEGLGYALVNFLTADAAAAAISCLAGVQVNGHCLEVELSRAHKAGLQGLIERFRNSAVMQADMPELFKPLLLQHGRAVPFPSA